MIMKTLILLLTSKYLVSCIPPPHPAVVSVRREEEQLPHHLRKPALRNPHLWNVLPLTSVLHKGENLVYERDADDISRMEIFNILTHAGFLPRRFKYSSQHLDYPSKHHDYALNHRDYTSKSYDYASNYRDYTSKSYDYASNYRDYASNNINHVSKYQHSDDPPFFLSPDLIQYL